MSARVDNVPVLALRQVVKHFGRRRLLDIDELGIHGSACKLLTGRNGAGKTTLLKIAAGIERPDRAEVAYGGQTLSWDAARRLYQRDVIYMHQFPYLFDGTVAENIAYGLRGTQVPKAEVARKVEEALEWSGLSHLARRHTRKLSGGEKQRVALTRAWVLSPRVLLLDEPCASLDEEAREHTAFLIRRLKHEGMGLLITAHDVRPLETLVDEHWCLRDGTLERGEMGRARVEEISWQPGEVHHLHPTG